VFYQTTFNEMSAAAEKRHRQKRSAIALPSPLSNVSSKNSIIISSNNRRSVSHCKLSIIDAENHLLILPPAAFGQKVPDTLSVDKLFPATAAKSQPSFPLKSY
jgi:hypothetical protein